tara:strand:- start:6525 stop:7085 length:561 start_codon:yes stop_codon:yes gene_type:complete
MRIIGGNYKGKKITIPLNNNTRPLRDLVKESIFNLIEHSNNFSVKLKNSVILDLFSGTGSFGLECFSRGAESVLFIENYKSILRILKKNILTLGAEKNSIVIEEDCFEYFSKKINFEKKFDIVFLDPPFKEKKASFLLDKIINDKILKKNGIVIIHRHKNDNLEIDSKLNVIDTRYYGISKIIILN